MHIYQYISAESKPKYDRTVITIAQKHGIDTACVHIAKIYSKK